MRPSQSPPMRAKHSLAARQYSCVESQNAFMELRFAEHHEKLVSFQTSSALRWKMQVFTVVVDFRLLLYLHRYFVLQKRRNL